MSLFLHARTFYFFFIILGFFSLISQSFGKDSKSPQDMTEYLKWAAGGEHRNSNIRQNKNTLKWMQVTYMLCRFYFSFKLSPPLRSFLPSRHLSQQHKQTSEFIFPSFTTCVIR